MNGAAVSVTGLRKVFRSGQQSLVAVDDVSLTVAESSTVALTGPSGSGKSTLLHLIGAIERPDEGAVMVDDIDVMSLSKRALARYRGGIGFVFQRFHLIPTISVLDNILAPLIPRRVDFDRDERARELLAAVGLAGRERSLPTELSGGQQQRVAIARALIGRPRLLLADEPTGNLDSKSGTEVLDLLEALHAEHPMTVVIATHEHHVAARCDRLVRMRDGRIVADTAVPQDSSDAFANAADLRS